jgi:hypothetical protein
MPAVHVELFYDSMDRAIEAGFRDAVPVDDDDPDTQYMVLCSFECDNYEVTQASCLDMEVFVA